MILCMFLIFLLCFAKIHLDNVLNHNPVMNAFIRLKGRLQCLQKHGGCNADEATSVVLTYYPLHKSQGENTQMNGLCEHL